MLEVEWIRLPTGVVNVGSTQQDVDWAFDFWKDKLLDASYVEHFKSFLMKEYPQYQTEIPSFEISDTLVTNGMYQEYIKAAGAPVPESLRNEALGRGEDCPVWGVSFSEAQSFCEWLSTVLDARITLPNEEEWEYAARGSTRREYPWGEEWNPDYCNSYEAGIGRTTPVRQLEKGRSYFGLYDMAGNVEEWVDTIYQEHPGGAYVKDDIYEAVGAKYQVLKGGSFARGGDLCRVARRHGPFPAPEFRFTGFRIVRRT